METVFIVEHVYESGTDEEVKFIGVFDSPTKASAAIEDLRYKAGFSDHSIECFVVSECQLNKYEWKEGFISWNDA